MANSIIFWASDSLDRKIRRRKAYRRKHPVKPLPMTDLEVWLKTCLNDDEAWPVFADWLEKRGDERSTIIREPFPENPLRAFGFKVCCATGVVTKETEGQIPGVCKYCRGKGFVQYRKMGRPNWDR